MEMSEEKGANLKMVLILYIRLTRSLNDAQSDKIEESRQLLSLQPHSRFFSLLSPLSMLLRPAIRSTWRLSNRVAPYSASFHHKPPPFPTLPSCPSPTCSCAETPSMPEGLEIDHSKPLNGTMAPYAEQVLICTGKEDWPSRIEEENSGDNLAADIKELLGRGGIYSDVSITRYNSYENKLLMIYSLSIMYQSPIPPFHPRCRLDLQFKQPLRIFSPPSNIFLSFQGYHLTPYKP
jgi:hypothetical protein